MQANRPRVLFLSYDGMTDPLGQAQVIPYLEGLSPLYELHLISAEKPERAEYQPLIQERLQEAGITWHPVPYTKSPPILSTTRDLGRMRKLAKRLHERAPFQLVHCRSYIAALIGLHMQRKYGVRFLFDMRGFWIDERIDGNIWNPNSWLFKPVIRYFRRQEKAFLTQADHIISLTEAGKRAIQRWELPAPPSEITVIPCCADLERFSPSAIDPEKVAELRQQLNLPAGTGPVLLYLGSLGTWYLGREMMDFFKVVKAEHPEAVFLVVTADSSDMVRQLATEAGVDPSHLRITRSAYADVPQHIALADIGLFFIKPAFSKQASSPTKQGELMGMELPLVCNAGVGDTAEIVAESRAGAVLDQFNEAAYQSVSGALPQLLQKDKASIRAGAEQFYSLAEGVRRYRAVYAHLLGTGQEEEAS